MNVYVPDLFVCVMHVNVPDLFLRAWRIPFQMPPRSLVAILCKSFILYYVEHDIAYHASNIYMCIHMHMYMYTMHVYTVSV